MLNTERGSPTPPQGNRVPSDRLQMHDDAITTISAITVTVKRGCRTYDRRFSRAQPLIHRRNAVCVRTSNSNVQHQHLRLRRLVSAVMPSVLILPDVCFGIGHFPLLLQTVISNQMRPRRLRGE